MKIKQDRKISKKIYPISAENIFEPRIFPSYESSPWLNSTMLNTTKVIGPSKNNRESNISKNLHGIMKPTKMKKKKCINQDKNAMKNITMKSIKDSLGNFFRTSKRIGRYQEELQAVEKKALQVTTTPKPTFNTNNCKLTNFQPITLVHPVISNATPKKSTHRTQVRTNISTFPQNKSEVDSKMGYNMPKMGMKSQPTMGIDMKIRKNKINTEKNVKVEEVIDEIISKKDTKIDLMPFLDSIDSFDIENPDCASTFMGRSCNKPTFSDIIDSPVSIRRSKYVTVVPNVESNNIFNRI